MDGRRNDFSIPYSRGFSFFFLFFFSSTLFEETLGTAGTSFGENDVHDDDEHYRKAIQFGFRPLFIRFESFSFASPPVRFLARNIETIFSISRFILSRSERRYRSLSVVRARRKTVLVDAAERVTTVRESD